MASAGVAVSYASEDSAFLTRLPVNQVAESDGQLYVRTRDQRRGATQALERLLVGRATVLAAHWLCNFTPKANQRFDAKLQGVSLIHSHEADGVLDVVIRLKKQKPECAVKAVAPRPKLPASPEEEMTSGPQIPSVTVPEASANNAAVDVVISIEQKSPLQTPSESTDTGSKVRVYSTEH
jgi:hypothetical protein